MRLVSLFSGCGGLDLGFERAGFDVVWANEFDKSIWETYEFNHRGTVLDRRSVTDIPASEVPECDGIIGGPPCQSWSAGGSKRGLGDKRGRLFWDYIRILDEKNPKFFVAENVKGMLLGRYGDALENFKDAFRKAGRHGYDLYFQLVNAADYSVPEDRERVLFIGIRKDLGLRYKFPDPSTPAGGRLTLKDAIWDIRASRPKPVPNGITGRRPQRGRVKNNEYLTGGFSPIYMSRNRVRGWDEVSFTIQAGGRQAPIHPSAPKMVRAGQDRYEFAGGGAGYRRLSVRECARIQTFPDDFVFLYDNISDGYKMIGNAVPVNLAYTVAMSIKLLLGDE